MEFFSGEEDKMIANLTKKRYVACNPWFARRFYHRLRGMIGRKFSNSDAMVFENCNAVHTLFTEIDLDLIFVNSNCQVVKVCSNVKPWRVVYSCRKACLVIELPSGMAARSKTEVGDILNLTMNSLPECQISGSIVPNL